MSQYYELKLTEKEVSYLKTKNVYQVKIVTALYFLKTNSMDEYVEELKNKNKEFE